MFDECEYLKKWDVDKFEIIRKIWDNTSTPVIFAGTQELENILDAGRRARKSGAALPAEVGDQAGGRSRR